MKDLMLPDTNTSIALPKNLLGSKKRNMQVRSTEESYTMLQSFSTYESEEEIAAANHHTSDRGTWTGKLNLIWTDG